MTTDPMLHSTLEHTFDRMIDRRADTEKPLAAVDIDIDRRHR